MRRYWEEIMVVTWLVLTFALTEDLIVWMLICLLKYHLALLLVTSVITFKEKDPLYINLCSSISYPHQQHLTHFNYFPESHGLYWDRKKFVLASEVYKNYSECFYIVLYKTQRTQTRLIFPLCLCSALKPEC